MLLEPVWQLFEEEVFPQPSQPGLFNLYRDRHEAVDLPDAPGLVSRTDEFYEVDINSVDPKLSADDWTLAITGAVEQEAEVTYRIIPGMYELLSGQVSISQIREVDVNDLLRRDPIQLEMNRIAEILRDRVVLVTGASVLVAAPLAYLTVRTDVPGKRVLTVLLAMPLVVPSYIGAFAFTSAFGPRGLVAGWLGFSLPSIYGFGGASLVLTLYTYPYVFITTRAALKTLDTTLVDAARTLRHSQLGAFRRITVPQIKPGIAAGSLLVALYTLSDFGTPAIMRFDVYTVVIYGALQYDLDLAVLLSLQLIVVTTVILAVESRLRGSGVESEHPGRQRSQVRLGRWRWPAFAAALVVPTLALVVPVGILSLWLVRDSATPPSSLAFQPAFAVNTIGVGVAAAGVAAAFALPLAYVAARRDGRLSGLFERASYVGYAVPGVVMGLALVYFGARYTGVLYRTGVILLPLLVFAYVVRFLPQAVGSTRASFEQVSPSLTEAARTLGEPPTSAFRRVTLPLVAPGLLGGAALVALTTMKELPATLLLRPASFDTLVTHIWTAQQAGYYGQAAIPALVLLGVSAASMLVVIRLEGYDVE